MRKQRGNCRSELACLTANLFADFSDKVCLIPPSSSSPSLLTIESSMSRLIIKNLPSYVTPERLKEHFQQKSGPGGTLTDFKVALKQDGTSRRFGFVGFKTEKEAASARDWFDRTFIDSTRISVSVIEVGNTYLLILN